MEIWKFNDPEPLRPFLMVLDQEAHSLAESARRLLGEKTGGTLRDLTSLATGLVDSRQTVREAVRVLIFSPPVEEEIEHFSRLLSWLPHWLPNGWHDDLSLRRLVAELASTSETPNCCSPMGINLQCALKERLRSWRKEATGLSAMWQTAARRRLLAGLVRRLPYRLTPGLRRRILDVTDLSLGHFCEALEAASRLPPMGSIRHWREMVLLATVVHEPILTSASSRSERLPRGGARDLRVISWGDRQSTEIAYLEKLISYQVNEVKAVRRLAEEVSRRTRSVVLTLHNASLGASSGWGMPSFLDQISGESAPFFVEEVNSLRSDFSIDLSHPEHVSQAPDGPSSLETVHNLFHLWSQRLVRPRLIEDLWALRSTLLLNGLPMDEWELFFSQARELLDDDDYHRLIQGERLAITLDSPLPCRRRLHQVLVWYLSKKESHNSFFRLLWSLLLVGSNWLKAERLPYFVLPIIDKFFISSRRDQDLDYLPLFVKLATHISPAPFILLVDDTSRLHHPSLRLAMERWSSKYDFLGLGVFGNEVNPATTPLETILSCYPQIRLFAVRPLDQVPRTVSFKTLLARRPDTFLTPTGYDSTWKDNLPFLYQGTQVAPLAGPLKRADEFSPGVTTSAGPMAFGTYYRHKLRQLALEEFSIQVETPVVNQGCSADLERLWGEYAYLANLL